MPECTDCFKKVYRKFKGCKDLNDSVRSELNLQFHEKFSNIPLDWNHFKYVPQLPCLATHEWKAFSCPRLFPGLYIIRNVFSEAHQQYWVSQCMNVYVCKPNRTNLDEHYFIPDSFSERSSRYSHLSPTSASFCKEPNISQQDSQCGLARNPSHFRQHFVLKKPLPLQPFTQNDADCALSCRVDQWENYGELLLKKLRWVTLGYHHNWETKKYSEQLKSEFPSNLAELSSFLVTSVLSSVERDISSEKKMQANLLKTKFTAQAAIVNFYDKKSFLGGHIDNSELATNSPLLSMSFGNSAIFLIGENALSDPIPILVQSGDVVIMSEQSRYFMHGVPKIFQESCPEFLSNLGPETVSDNFSSQDIGDYMRKSRINISVRQVLPDGMAEISS
eukprot:Sdes_comp19410_c0_seq1m10736